MGVPIGVGPPGVAGADANMPFVFSSKGLAVQLKSDVKSGVCNCEILEKLNCTGDPKILLVADTSSCFIHPTDVNGSEDLNLTLTSKLHVR